jgi:hypothetical protein
LQPREIALPLAKSSGARFSKQIRHTGVVVVRETDPPEPDELSISPPSMSRVPRLELLSAMTGTVAVVSCRGEDDAWRVFLRVPASRFVSLLVFEVDGLSFSIVVSGEERQGLEKNANARCPKVCGSSLLAGD